MKRCILNMFKCYKILNFDKKIEGLNVDKNMIE